MKKTHSDTSLVTYQKAPSPLQRLETLKQIKKVRFKDFEGGELCQFKIMEQRLDSESDVVSDAK